MCGGMHLGGPGCSRSTVYRPVTQAFTALETLRCCAVGPLVCPKMRCGTLPASIASACQDPSCDWGVRHELGFACCQCSDRRMRLLPLSRLAGGVEWLG
eukprot:354196-Chlamydomonas_euryale.AAC.2